MQNYLAKILKQIDIYVKMLWLLAVAMVFGNTSYLRNYGR